MQIKLQPENINSMIENGKFEISQLSENQIDVFKNWANGKIHLRMKRENSRYLIDDHYYWVANFHFEHGIRPNRIFESELVQEFAKKYLIPYAKQ